MGRSKKIFHTLPELARRDVLGKLGAESATYQDQDRAVGLLLNNIRATIYHLRTLPPSMLELDKLIGLMAAFPMADTACRLIIYLKKHGTAPEHSAVAGSLAMEQAVARHDGRPPQYRRRRDNLDDTPVGKTALVPEGAETGTGNRLHDIEYDIYQKTGLGLFKTIELFERNALAATASTPSPSFADGRLDARQREKLAKFFRRARNGPEATYYVPQHVDLPPDLRADADQLTAGIREHYPDVLIVPCDSRLMQDDEIQDLLINSIPIEG